MGFPNSMQSSGNVAIVAGSIVHTSGGGITGTTGEGFSAAVSSGVFTITLDRQYDGLISATATVQNASPATGEASVAVVTAATVTADTDGASIVIKCVDDDGVVDTNTDAHSIHFLFVLKEDT